MRQLSPAGRQAIADIAQRQGFSQDAVASMLESVINGNGSMAQFNHPEFSGSGQWMRGGMTMVSDMFNNYLKGRVDGLCSALSNLVANQPDLVRSGSFQSQSQGGQSQGSGQQQFNGSGYGNSQSQNGNGQNSPASLFVPAPPDWWGTDLRYPNSTGAQNGARYAYFAQARRLAIEVHGRVTVYDTLDHQIGGFGQQQSGSGSISFSSQYGLIDVASLPVISVDGMAPYVPPAPAYAPQNSSFNSSSNGSSNSYSNAPQTSSQEDVFATIEKLSQLHAKGILSNDEYQSKKAELIGRL